MWLVMWTQGKLSASVCVCHTSDEARQVIDRVNILAERDIEWSIEYVPIWTATPMQSENSKIKIDDLLHPGVVAHGLD